MTQFVSALELATYFDGTTELADLSAEWIAQADLLLEMISADVEAAAGVPIAGGSKTVLLAGTWSRDLELPGGVILDVSAVTLNGVALSAGEWTWNDRGLLRRGDFFGDDDFELLAARPAQGAQQHARSSWGGPASTVAAEIDFDAEIPDVVRALVLRIGARTIGNIGQVTQESLGPYSVSYGSTVGTTTNDGSHVTAAERKRLRSALGARKAGTVTIGGR